MIDKVRFKNVPSKLCCKSVHATKCRSHWSWGKIVALCLIFGLSISAPPARAEFVGELELLPIGCQESGQCSLGKDFGFIDSSGMGWQAAKELLTDGASIPPWAQVIVGQPFEKAFVRAAVIHDHYCDRRVRPWRQTHKVFYDGLLVGGVPKGKAGIMYFAVLVGGPKWVKLIKGRPCPVGMGCINSLQIGASIQGGQFGVDEAGGLLMVREPEYSSAHFSNIMDENRPKLENSGDGLTTEQVEKLAKEVMKDDFYFINGDEVGSDLGIRVESQ